MRALCAEISPDLLRLAEACDYEQGHSVRVTILAGRLFDELKQTHMLPDSQSRLLAAAAILHDIGWCRGGKAHHKAAYDIITRQRPASLSPREAEVVGLVARYHRKALPSPRHAAYARLAADDREAVSRLAAMLRVADGLDRGHRNAVLDVHAETRPGRVFLRLELDGPADLELWAARRKADLFEKAFGAALDISAI